MSIRPGRMVMPGQVDPPRAGGDDRPRAAAPDHRDDAAVGDHHHRLLDHPAGEHVDHPVGGDDDGFGLRPGRRRARAATRAKAVISALRSPGSGDPLIVRPERSRGDARFVSAPRLRSGRTRSGRSLHCRTASAPGRRGDGGEDAEQAGRPDQRRRAVEAGRSGGGEQAAVEDDQQRRIDEHHERGDAGGDDQQHQRLGRGPLAMIAMPIGDHRPDQPA